MEKKGIIFDLDGTLWDASKQIIPAWNLVLKRHNEIDKQITMDEMINFFGKTIDVIAKIMFPNMDSEKMIKILSECCNEEQIYLRENGGELYPGLEGTLKNLSQKYYLYIVSNCQDGYVQAFLEYHMLSDYFCDIEMAGRTGKSKGENIKDIIERNKLTKSVYVGDTDGDLQGACYAGIPFIYARYGFGEVRNAKYSINCISEMVEIIGEII